MKNTNRITVGNIGSSKTLRTEDQLKEMKKQKGTVFSTIKDNSILLKKLIRDNYICMGELRGEEAQEFLDLMQVK